VRRISFVLLLLEAAVLIYPSFIGLLLVLSAFVPLATNSISSAQLGEAAIAAIALAGLLIGWTLLATRLVRGIEPARSLPRALWVVAVALAVLACVGFMLRLSDSPLQMLGLGIYFVPTFLHLVMDVWLGRVPNEFVTAPKSAT